MLANQYLEQAGIETRIDARSYEEQGIARIPQVHVGSAAWRLEQQGIRTAPGDRNREVAAANQAIETSQTEIVTAQENVEIELRLEIEQRAEAERAAAEKTQLEAQKPPLQVTPPKNEKFGEVTTQSTAVPRQLSAVELIAQQREKNRLKKEQDNLAIELERESTPARKKQREGR